MRKNIYALALAALLLFAGKVAAQTTLHTSGKYLLDICEDTVLLRGIDYAPYNWGYDATSNEIAEIAQTGANCVRLVWYANSTAPYYTTDLLDSILGSCAANHMVPILVLLDQTCNDTISELIALANWYTGAAVKAVLLKHQAYLVVNIANEALYHNWSSYPAAAAASDYTAAYDTIVSNMRTAGLNFPLMIDAPDCGTDISIFSAMADSIRNADPQHNMLFSAHAYWYSYANNDSGQMSTLISTAAALDVPVLLGEFANYQDGTSYCQYPLDYTALLHICQQYSFPWLCWSWDNDECNPRQLSNGTFASLTTYGNDIVNNAGYGIKNYAVRSAYLLNDEKCIATGVGEATRTAPALTCYQPAEGVLEIRSYTPQFLKIMDITGSIVYSGLLPSAGQVSVSLPAGIYLIISDKQTSFKQLLY